MTTSLYEATGLTVLISEPLFALRAGTERSYTNELSSYTHKRSAFLDFDNASIELKGDHIDAEDWIEYGIGRHVTVKDGFLDTVFQGFVDSLEVIAGGLTVKRGPLMGIGNRVSVVYAELDNTVNPPTVGDRTVTTIEQDEDSQQKYGIVEKVVSAGQISTAEANQLRDAYLEENKLPETSQGINSMGSGPGITIRMDCLGYGHWLNAYVYNQNLVSSTTQVSAKIEAVLAEDPNNLISTNYSNIVFNGVLVTAYENDDPYGLTVIKELVSYGDVAYDRYLFQIDDNRIVKYFEQPVDWLYQMSLGENEIRTIGGAEVSPWSIKPGQWIRITDFLAGRSEKESLRQDPRMVFIESVDFTAPYEYRIQGSKSKSFKQILSQFGMKGLVS